MKKYEMTLDAYMSLKDAAEVFQKIAEREEKEQLKQRQTKRENELKN
ncbi:hypothetical protein MXM59_05285 [Mammaliicoccus sciuri]|nr:hypothetical protein [Mammaliicoccus sciuri]MCD8836024.1 hypothetical protein [Mammaliicoccus sciuri]MCJ0938999.1 hypothetical protein [Mammaliicoccus sciuri]MCJ0964167.1 hypothetical protein [Mammaliicoccus sciuri]MEB6226628.1 hypothetical protein [Mammaliicoccus sciuri]